MSDAFMSATSGGIFGWSLDFAYGTSPHRPKVNCLASAALAASAVRKATEVSVATTIERRMTHSTRSIMCEVLRKGLGLVTNRLLGQLCDSLPLNSTTRR